MSIVDNKNDVDGKSFSESRLILNNRKILSLTGVEKVFEANENRVQLKVAGSNLCVLGEGLNVVKLDVDKGEIEIAGLINDIKYTNGDNKGNFLRKIFK